MSGRLIKHNYWASQFQQLFFIGEKENLIYCNMLDSIA